MSESVTRGDADREVTWKWVAITLAGIVTTAALGAFVALQTTLTDHINAGAHDVADQRISRLEIDHAAAASDRAELRRLLTDMTTEIRLLRQQLASARDQ